MTPNSLVARYLPDQKVLLCRCRVRNGRRDGQPLTGQSFTEGKARSVLFFAVPIA
jgi:hypothetical protein